MPANICDCIRYIHYSDRGFFFKCIITYLRNSLSVNHLWDIQNGCITGIASNRNRAIAIIGSCPNDNGFCTAIAAVSGTADIGIFRSVIAGIAGSYIFGRPISSRCRS